MSTNTAWRRQTCWVCRKPFRSSRETAMCCSAACRQWRSRFAKKHGHFPTRDYAYYLWCQEHPEANTSGASQESSAEPPQELSHNKRPRVHYGYREDAGKES